MKYKSWLPLFSFLAILFATSLACRMPEQVPLAQASTPPALPTYIAPTPTATPIKIEPIEMVAGESITLTDGRDRFIWIEYLGNQSGYSEWNCLTNAPLKEKDCHGRDAEVHQNVFYWGGKSMAWNHDDGTIRPYEGWYIFDPSPNP